MLLLILILLYQKYFNIKYNNKTNKMLKKIISNTIAQIISKIFTAIIAIVLIWLLTKYLTVELYWTYSKVYNYAYIFAFLVDLWLYAITIKEISTNKDKAEYIFWNILTLRLITWLSVFIFSILIAIMLPWYNSSLDLSSIFILWFFTIFSLLNSSFLALMQSYMKMEFSIISIVSWKLLVLALTFFGIYYIFPINTLNWNYFYSFLWIILSWTLGMFLNMIFNYFYVKKIIKIKFILDWTYIKHIFKISIPYGIALFLSVVYTKIDIFLLSLMEKGVLWERSIALYSLPLKIMDVFMIMWAFFLNSLLPILSENYKANNIDKIKNILENAFKVMFGSAIWIVSLWLVFKEIIIKIIATPDYLEKTDLNKYTSSDAFSVVLFILLFFYISLIFSYLLVATERQNRLLIISIILTIINIIWNIIFIPYLSFIWAWIVTVITQISFLILSYLFTKDILTFKFPLKFILYTSIFWIILYILWTYLINNLSLWLYLDLIYWMILFWIYGIFVWKIEYISFKKQL